MKLFLFVLGVALVTAQLQAIHLTEPHITGVRSFADEYGRQRYFHGANAVVKGPPWVPRTDAWDPETSMVAKDFELMQSMGLNVLRLGTMWPGVVPNKAKEYNETYLNQIKNITLTAAKYGIYTFLDMHQDVLSEKFCGEGSPAWATYESPAVFPSPLGPPVTEYWDPVNKFPLQADCDKYGWGSLYFTQACGEAFQALYDNTNGIRDSWKDFWVKVVSTFVGHKEILAIDLINEPWSGDANAHPSLMIPGFAEKKNLQPAFDDVATAIWEADPSRLVMFEGVTWDDPVPSGFDHAPGGAQNNNRSVFSFHFYMPPQFAYDAYFLQRFRDAERLGTAAMLTEFDGLQRDEQGQNTGLDIFNNATAHADTYLLSWAFWEFKDFCLKNKSDPFQADVSQWDTFGACKTGYGSTIWLPDGTVDPMRKKAYSRTYAQAVAGVAHSMHFDINTGVFKLLYTASEEINANVAPTVIYLSKEIYYPNGFTVDINPPGSATWKQAGANTIEVIHRPAATLIDVVIVPK